MQVSLPDGWAFADETPSLGTEPLAITVASLEIAPTLGGTTTTTTRPMLFIDFDGTAESVSVSFKTNARSAELHIDEDYVQTLKGTPPTGQAGDSAALFLVHCDCLPLPSVQRRTRRLTFKFLGLSASSRSSVVLTSLNVRFLSPSPAPNDNLSAGLQKLQPNQVDMKSVRALLGDTPISVAASTLMTQIEHAQAHQSQQLQQHSTAALASVVGGFLGHQSLQAISPSPPPPQPTAPSNPVVQAPSAAIDPVVVQLLMAEIERRMQAQLDRAMSDLKSHFDRRFDELCTNLVKGR